VRERILFNLMQVAVVLLFAPLASGVLSRLKEMVHHGRINAYVTYAFVALLIVIAVLPTS
jgi:hypothetical protein